MAIKPKLRVVENKGIFCSTHISKRSHLLMDKSEELATLRRERLIAISRCEFKKARDIDNQLQRLKETFTHNQKIDNERRAQSEFDLERENVMSEAEKAYSDATSKIFDAQHAFQKKMASLQQKHADELSFLNESFAKDLELASIREIPEFSIYRKQAQVSALVQKYDLAELLFTLAEQTREATLQERQEKVNQTYEILMNQVLDRQNAEDKTCEDMFLKHADSIRRKHQEENERLMKRLECRAISLKIPPENVEMPVFNNIELILDNIHLMKEDPVNLDDQIEIVRPQIAIFSISAKSPLKPESPKRFTTSPITSRSPRSSVSPKPARSPKSLTSPKASRTPISK